MIPREAIRDRVLRGLAANRVPGFHYAGSFLGVSFEDISADAFAHSPRGRPALHRVARAGEPGRRGDDRRHRACRVSIRAALRLRSRAARHGQHASSVHRRSRSKARSKARGAFEGFIRGTASRQGLARVSVDGNGPTRVLRNRSLHGARSAAGRHDASGGARTPSRRGAAVGRRSHVVRGRCSSRTPKLPSTRASAQALLHRCLLGIRAAPHANGRLVHDEERRSREQSRGARAGRIARGPGRPAPRWPRCPRPGRSRRSRRAS